MSTPLGEMDLRAEEYRRKLRGLPSLEDTKRLRTRQDKLLVRENKRLNKSGLIVKRIGEQ